MNILGLYGAFGWDSRENWVHDSGATLIKSGKHICSISEERLSRLKYDGDYPEKSIDYCLSLGELTKNDIDLVIIPSMSNETFNSYVKKGKIKSKIEEEFPNASFEIISHHLSHAYSTVFSCDYEEGTFLTLDGAGTSVQDSYGNVRYIEDSSIGYFNKKKNIFRFFPYIGGLNNFGHYYQSWSGYIYQNKIEKQIPVWHPEIRESLPGKIMGLSAYGNKEKIDELSDEYDINTQSIPGVIFKGFSGDSQGEFFSQYKYLKPDDQAGLLQKTFEKSILEYFETLKDYGYLENNLCLAGGVFLNVLSNTILKQNDIVENIHIPPFTNDSGLHFGAACYGAFKHNQTIELPTNIALLGKEYSDEEILKSIQEYEEYIEYEELSSIDDVCVRTASLLNDDKIVGWFQGRSEFGPRALGSRSIFMNVTNSENKDILNERIKHREYWRPFAGIILEENHKDYFEDDFESPYMLYSHKVKSEKTSDIPAITHEDNTCRIQTVNGEYNEVVTKLLKEYYNLSGVPAILNTSFNDNGQPIIESPQDAVETLLKIDIDILVIGKYIVTRK
jgi:carbamoyltransferase